jgi:hypothetical protein
MLGWSLKVSSETFDAEGMDVERQVCQPEEFVEQAIVDCTNFDAEDVKEDSIGDSFLFAGVREGMDDVELDFEVFDEFAGKGTGL